MPFVGAYGCLLALLRASVDAGIMTQVRVCSGSLENEAENEACLQAPGRSVKV